mmetsp:Transcript_4102/g.11979  ORF Transcript_4102/g.11979 Transcript_4102/m.11979 type:complete len:159 (-) Transcript_4102:531-1007(-)
MPPGNRKRKAPRIEKSLAYLLPTLYGKVLTVEMKDDTEVTGTLGDATMDMGMTLLGARLVSASGAARTLDIVFLRGGLVRYVHLPEDVHPVAAVAQHLRRQERIQRLYAKSQRKPGEAGARDSPYVPGMKRQKQDDTRGERAGGSGSDDSEDDGKLRL